MPNAMPEEFKYDVFFSYSTKDKEKVHRLYDRLVKDGVRVWLDDKELLPGDVIIFKCLDGVQNSRRLFLFVSRDSMGSEYVIQEMDMMRARDPSGRKRLIVPIRLDDVDLEDSVKKLFYLVWRTESEEEYAPIPETAKDQNGSSDTPIQSTKTDITTLERLAVTVGSDIAISGLHTFLDLANEIGQRLNHSKHVSVLLRTGMQWWIEYQTQLEQCLSIGGSARIMVLNPRDEEVFRVSENKENRIWRPEDFDHRRQQAIDWLDWIKKNYYPAVEPKTIKYIPSWSLVMLNEHHSAEPSTVYVEFSLYFGKNGGRASIDRPFLKVGSKANGLFMLFKQQYEDSWKDAEPWQ